MKTLGAMAVSQPIFLIELGRNFRLYLDEGFRRLVYPYRQMLDAGIPLAFSSDAPVVRDFGPLSGIRAAIVAGAVADGQEAFKGMLKPGYVADMVVLTGNPCDTDPAALSRRMVKKVWLAGRDMPRLTP